MVAQLQARTSAGTRECQAPRDLMRKGNGMSPEIHPWNTGDALLLRFRRVWCPRIDRGIVAEWTSNSPESGRGQSGNVPSPCPRSVHGFVRGLSEAVDYPQPQTCPQSVRELAADSTATWLIPRPGISRAVPARWSRKGQGVSVHWPSGYDRACPYRFLSLSAGCLHEGSRHVLV